VCKKKQSYADNLKLLSFFCTTLSKTKKKTKMPILLFSWVTFCFIFLFVFIYSRICIPVAVVTCSRSQFALSPAFPAPTHRRCGSLSSSFLCVCEGIAGKAAELLYIELDSCTNYAKMLCRSFLVAVGAATSVKLLTICVLYLILFIALTLK